jgi:hypothetical protein
MSKSNNGCSTLAILNHALDHKPRLVDHLLISRHDNLGDLELP